MTADFSVETARSRPGAALAWDLRRSAVLTPYWIKLAYGQVRGKYHRLALGLIWHPLGFALVVSLIAYVFGALFGRDTYFFLPYLAAGFAVWGFITGCMTGGAAAFTSNQRHILSRRTPLAMFAWKAAGVAAIGFLLEIPFFFVACAYVGRPLEPVALIAVPGAALLLLNGLWVTMLFGVAVTRFPDLGQLLQSAVRVLFLVTPIIWSIDINPRIANVSQWNPFYHAIELVRGPLLGYLPPAESYFVVSGIALGGILLTLPIFAISIRRLPYWL